MIAFHARIARLEFRVADLGVVTKMNAGELQFMLRRQWILTNSLLNKNVEACLANQIGGLCSASDVVALQAIVHEPHADAVMVEQGGSISGAAHNHLQVINAFALHSNLAQAMWLGCHLSILGWLKPAFVHILIA